MRTVLCAATLAWFLAGESTAQFNADPVVQVSASLNVDKIRQASNFKVLIKTAIDPEWHINSHQPLEDFLIPTIVTFDSIPGLRILKINYPEGHQRVFQFSEQPVSVYDGNLLVSAEMSASEELPLGDLSISGKFSYQACNDVSCLAPAEEPFQISTRVVDASTQVAPLSAEAELGQLQGDRSGGENRISQLISGKGMAVALLAIFVGGLALNLTPCVYPVIPITISFFVGQASGSIGKSFLLALVYVLGMALTYSVLGVIAAMTGGVLGSSLQNPLVLIFIAAVFVVFAAGMFGAFEIRVPAFLNRLAGGSKQGVFGSLLMGLTVGIVAAPCIGPFVLSLLTYVAAQGDPYLGFIMFFVLSLGLGLPFLALGTFSGLAKNLPRSGEWMIWVKRVFGVIMIGVAVYFISTLIPDPLYVALLTAVAVLGGVLVGFIDKSKASFSWFKGLKPAVGILMILFGAWTSVSAWQQSHAPAIDWRQYSDELLEQARQQGRPVLIDFYADWCIPCKQIEKTLFSEPIVVAKSSEFVTLKADLTKDESETVKSIRQKYRVVGVPTVIIIDSQGNEYRRFTDELVGFDTEEFLQVMNGALQQHHGGSSN
jgi:thiol:disulfide interchange protein DsbD